MSYLLIIECSINTKIGERVSVTLGPYNDRFFFFHRRYEESIKLHDPSRSLPARPSSHMAAGNKSWFASVTAGLQRESLSLQELDLLGKLCWSMIR